MKTLEILYTVDTKGSGTQKSIRYHGDTILCPNDSKISVIHKEEHVKEIKVLFVAFLCCLNVFSCLEQSHISLTGQFQIRGYGSVPKVALKV